MPESRCNTKWSKTTFYKSRLLYIVGDVMAWHLSSGAQLCWFDTQPLYFSQKLVFCYFAVFTVAICALSTDKMSVFLDSCVIFATVFRLHRYLSRVMAGVSLREFVFALFGWELCSSCVFYIEYTIITCVMRNCAWFFQDVYANLWLSMTVLRVATYV